MDICCPTFAGCIEHKTYIISQSPSTSSFFLSWSVFHMCQPASSLLNLVGMLLCGASWGLVSWEAVKRQMSQLRTSGKLTPRNWILTNGEQETKGNSAWNFSLCCLLHEQLWGVVLLANLPEISSPWSEWTHLLTNLLRLFNLLRSNGQWSNPSHHITFHRSLSQVPFFPSVLPF